ncbi:MAG TPA: Hsp70 family protein [Pyrinomonadaceae bacterium]|jgi:molecular chaperone DnaK
MSKNPVVGIDLGTTNSAIAYINQYGKPEVLSNGEGKKITPSVVQIRSDDTTVVGEIAKQEIALEKENTAHFFKRDMGTNATYEYHGRFYTPVDLSAEILKKLKNAAEAILETPVTRAVITVPAYFHNTQRIATQKAGEKAGLEVLQMINEPTAAAVAYGFNQFSREEIIMVYDLGGGTFDISLVRVNPEGIEVIGTAGNHYLGGKNWDDRLLDYVCERFEEIHGINPQDDLYTFQELLVRTEEAKKTLSARNTTIIPINFQGIMDRIEVTRDRFEELTLDLLTQTEMLMTRVIEETGFDYSRIDSVLMVGGSTRMPSCAELIEKITSKKPNTSINPDECIALGAAVQGSEYGTEITNQRRGTMYLSSRIRDVTSHSMGMVAVSSNEERFINSVLIPKNKSVPSCEVRPFQVKTFEGRENTTSVYVTQGEGEDLANCSFVGKYVIGNIPYGGKNKSVLDITYQYDRSGVVNVSAIERKTRQTLSIIKEPLPEDMSWIHKSPKELAPVAVHKTVYLSIDLSGSMSGKPLEDAKKAVTKFVENSDLTSTSIGLIAFSNKVRVTLGASQDAKKILQAANSWEIGDGLGYGNSAQPFDTALAELGKTKGKSFLVVLTDGVWSYQEEAIKRAKLCHQQEIEVIAIGFGGADEKFLRAIATSDESALLVGGAELSSTFENIAQVLVESDSSSLGSNILFRRR